MTISAKEAQDRLPDLLNQVAQGEDIEITSGDGSITCRLVMVARKTTERVPDLHPNALVMSDDFDDEDPEINAMFYGDA